MIKYTKKIQIKKGIGEYTPDQRPHYLVFTRQKVFHFVLKHDRGNMYSLINEQKCFKRLMQWFIKRLQKQRTFNMILKQICICIVLL